MCSSPSNVLKFIPGYSNTQPLLTSKTQNATTEETTLAAQKAQLLSITTQAIPYDLRQKMPPLLRLINCVEHFIVQMHRAEITAHFPSGNKATPHYLYRYLIKEYAGQLAESGNDPTPEEFMKYFIDFLTTMNGFTFR